MAATALLATGCSVLLVRYPGSRAETGAPACTQTVAPPVFDALVAAGGAALLAYYAPQMLRCPNGDCKEDPGPLLFINGAGVVAGLAGSAFYGFRSTAECRQRVASWCESHDCGPFAAAPLETGQRTPSSSTSNTSVALGGIAPGNPSLP